MGTGIQLLLYNFNRKKFYRLKKIKNNFFPRVSFFPQRWRKLFPSSHPLRFILGTSLDPKAMFDGLIPRERDNYVLTCLDDKEKTTKRNSEVLLIIKTSFGYLSIKWCYMVLIKASFRM